LCAPEVPAVQVFRFDFSQDDAEIAGQPLRVKV
jgi:hypothetical protein